MNVEPAGRQKRRSLRRSSPVDRFAVAREIQIETRRAKALATVVTAALGERAAEHQRTEQALERANAVIACIQRALKDAGYAVNDDLHLYDVVSELVREREAAVGRAKAAEDVAANLNRKLEQCPTST